MPATKSNTLTAAQVRNLKTAGMYADGNGLTLRIKPNGAKSWVQRLTIDGRRANAGLGSYPVVSLADARATAIENLRVIAQGGNPIQAKQQAKAERRSKAAIPCFADVAAQVIELRRPTLTPKHIKEWETTLQRFAFPYIGRKRIDTITSADVMECLAPIWNEKATTARRVRNRIEAVLDYAVAQGHREFNPAGKAIAKALPNNSKQQEHHEAIPYAELSGVLAEIRESSTTPIMRLAFELLVLCASRSNEVRGALWNEVNWECQTWTVPADRMKMRKEHRVPLSDRAMEVLREAWEISSEGGPDGLIFPSPRDKKPMTTATMARVLKENGIGGTIHGNRSAFRDWAIERTNVSWAVGESALAHRLGGSVETAYARTDLFEQRRELMQQWSDFLSA